MTAMELDPVFLRALRLLHSRSKDSTVQLKTMLDDAIKHRKGLGPGPLGLSPQPISPSSPGQQKSKVFEISKRETEKRNLDRLKLELSELVVPSKRARMESPGFSSKSHTPSPTPTPPGSRGDRAGNSGGSVGNSSEPDEDLDLDINLEGLNDCTCCICKSFNQENGNKLMECHTCQNLFHQECHLPNVSNEEANDPRLVWNCSDCIKTMPQLKSVKVPPSSGVKSSVSLSASKASSPSPRSSSKGFSGKSSGISNFKSGSSQRSFRGASSSSSMSNSNKSSGSSSSSTSSSNGNSGTSNSMDKRLQMLKKKATRKIK